MWMKRKCKLNFGAKKKSESNINDRYQSSTKLGDKRALHLAGMSMKPRVHGLIWIHDQIRYILKKQDQRIRKCLHTKDSKHISTMFWYDWASSDALDKTLEGRKVGRREAGREGRQRTEKSKNRKEGGRKRDERGNVGFSHFVLQKGTRGFLMKVHSS